MSIEDKRRAPEPKWLLAITTDSRHQIAQRTGETQSKITRQLSGASPLTADLVIQIARAYNADPVRALHMAGKLTTGEMRRYQGGTDSLATATRKVLLQELLRREPATD
ncbi:hypothetical protein [Corynebacterium hindlerae]|uniref:hypothetical protein n=1 Tax=Corynebacterium hindlerae TaxID=699041 RepID=UPI003AB0439F